MAHPLAMYLVALSAAAGVGAALNLAEVPCGKPTVGTRIVGGAEARRGQFPWLVSVQRRDQHWCGGTLVTRWFVVTAAHCLKARPAADFSVVVAEHDLSRADDGQRRLPVRAVALHPGYTAGKFRHDLAVLRLAAAADWGARVQPACLPPPAPAPGATPAPGAEPAPEPAVSPVGRTATVAGWGWLDEAANGGQRADTVHAVSVPVIGPAECSAWFADAGKRHKLRVGQLCAGYREGGKDGCEGDSGGPLLLTEQGRVTLVGVVSAGIGCGRPSLPGVYTDVAQYMDWIQKMTKSA